MSLSPLQCLPPLVNLPDYLPLLEDLPPPDQPSPLHHPFLTSRLSPRQSAVSHRVPKALSSRTSQTAPATPPTPSAFAPTLETSASPTKSAQNAPPPTRRSTALSSPTSATTHLSRLPRLFVTPTPAPVVEASSTLVAPPVAYTPVAIDTPVSVAPFANATASTMVSVVPVTPTAPTDATPTGSAPAEFTGGASSVEIGVLAGVVGLMGFVFAEL
jgi:hypothetical protein